MKVLTTKGLIEMDELRVQDVVEVGDNYRKVIVQYFLGDELVKQSVHTDMLRGLSMGATAGTLNGE